MLADLLIRPPQLTIAGATWPVLFDHAAILEMEGLTGRDVLAGELDLTRPRVKTLRAALFAVLRRAGALLTLGEVGALITPQLIPTIQKVLVEGWAKSMPDPEPVSAAGGGELAGAKLHRLDAWAIARYDLRLSDSEWLAMTPRQLEAIRKRQLEAMRREETLTGILASTMANFSPCRPKQALKAEDFMLHPFPPQPIDADYLLRAFAHIPKTKGSYGTN